MKNLVLTFLMISALGLVEKTFAQRKCGKLKNEIYQGQIIDLSVYHEYDLKLKKGTIVLLKVTDLDIAMEFTVVSPDGNIVEQINNADTGDYLIFESPMNGNYQFYIRIIDDECASGKYSLSASFISPNKTRLEQIEELIQLLERPGRAGTAISIIENGQSIFEHYFGYSNAEDKVKNNSETVFELASVSKQFTAMAIAILAEQQKLSVDDDIRLYFPELPIYKTPIRIKHLLNHTSGIIDSDFALELSGFENDPIDIDRVLNFLRYAPEQYFEPGSEFSYSNDGYTLLGELVKRITKQSFKDWAHENIFKPLDMHSTLIRDSPEIVFPNRAISYGSNMANYDYYRLSFDFHAPGGCSVRSSMNDLIKWVNYLNEGYHSNETLFQRINGLDKLNNGRSSEYAYGNFISDYRGIQRISHLGLSAGFRTSIARFPEENLSFIYLANDGDFRNYYLARKIYELFLSDKLAPTQTKFNGIETLILSNESENSVQPTDLIDFEGDYFSKQIHTSYSFEVIQDTLFAISAAYKPIPLTAVGKDTFETDKNFMETVIFKRDYEQSVSECFIYNDDEDYKISFRKISNTKGWTKNHRWFTSEHQKLMMDTLNKIETQKTLPGFVISIFDESETIFQEGFGYADTDHQKKYEPESIQLIASITKSVTGMAVMKAMEMGFFELDDAINEYLPFELTNPDFPDDEITIRHLLTHTSSLYDAESYAHGYVFSKSLEPKNWPDPHHEGLARYSDNKKMKLSEFLTEILAPNGKWFNENEMFTKHQPGTNFEYSNTGFALLGYIIELTSKENFKDFTQEHIFDPLDMKSATWELDRDNPKHITYYKENYKDCPDYTINTIPDGGLYINIIDLTKFLQEAMKGYDGRGKILSQSSYAEMFRSQTELIEIEGGLGWDLSISCCVGHAGNDFGTATVMYFQPSTGIGRIVFTNISTETDELSEQFYGIMNLLFE